MKTIPDLISAVYLLHSGFDKLHIIILLKTSSLFYLIKITSVFILLVLPITGAEAQTLPESHTEEAKEALLDTISRLDERYFDAFNNCELETLREMHAQDLEAIHDLGGGPIGVKELMGAYKSICSQSIKNRRELVPGSLKAYPLAGFGAIQMADQLFYKAEKEDEEKLVGRGKLIIFWKQTKNGWKIHRMASYDHGP